MARRARLLAHVLLAIAAATASAEQRHANGDLPERREPLGSSSDTGFPLVRSQRWYENGRLHWDGTFELEPGWKMAPRVRPCGLGAMCDDWADHFVDIRPHGRVQRFRDDGSLWTDYQFEHGLRRGRQLRFHPNGVLAEDWQAGEVDGSPIVDQGDGWFVAFYPDGSPQTFGQRRAGQRVGTWLLFGPSHVKSEERRYDAAGQPHGVWRRFDPSGRLVGEIVYEHGTHTPPPPACPPDPGDCPEPRWPAEPELPPSKLSLTPAVALRCPTDEPGPLVRPNGIPHHLGTAKTPEGNIRRWCSLSDDGSLISEGEATSGGGAREQHFNPFEGRLLSRYELTPGVVERKLHFDYDCLCKIGERVKALDRGGEETFTVWRTNGLLEARGPSRSEGRVRLGRWTFWGPDGRVSHWIDYEDGAEVRRIEKEVSPSAR
jgi:hypothetical protein